MKEEVESAVGFLTNILRSRDDVNEGQTNTFSSSLTNLLCLRYKDHWFPEKPFKGSGYRCIRLNHKMDPLILQAGRMCGLDSVHLESTFPPELTIWVDPNDVSFRIGENGSVGILYESTKQQQQSQEQIQQSSQSQLFSQNMDNLSGFQHSNRNLNQFLSCKEQFMSALPEMTYQQLARFVAS